MPRINLLPYRAELRRSAATSSSSGLARRWALLPWLLASNLVLSSIIGHQQDRNDLLKAEISALDKRIAEILDLEEKKERLLARMEIIEQLQRSRPEAVHVFDELVRTLPDGVCLTSVKQTGRRIEIEGAAESNTRVSALMRNIDGSEWLTQPDLEVVEVQASAPARRRVPARSRRASLLVAPHSSPFSPIRCP